jgi:transposase-like protein
VTIYQPVTAYSRSIKRPDCPRSGTRMMLSRIEPNKPDHDKRMFECPSCNHERSEIVKFK